MNDDLISRSAFLERMMRTARYFYVKFDIMEEPTVDAVKVVRCKYCEAWQTKNALSFLRDGIHVRLCPCEVLGRLMYDNDFCSKGKRRDD